MMNTLALDLQLLSGFDRHFKLTLNFSYYLPDYGDAGLDGSKTDCSQYLDLLKKYTPNTLSQDHLLFLQDLEHTGSEHTYSQSEWIDSLVHNEDAEKRERASFIRKAEVAASIVQAAEDKGVRIWSGPSADKEKPSLRINPQPDMPQMEKDFTTAGTPSKLGCPFASSTGRQSPLATPRSSTSRLSLRGSLRGRRSKRPSFNDPIRAEICGNDPVPPSASASVEGSAAVCPIRFLDQHQPEEVAKYFENHKHEIPRSHEVCIKRFQSNAESIQQLDRKYGNLVSMIQGLGQRHQEFLPPEPEEDEAEDPEVEAKTEERVQKWAKAVTASIHDGSPEEAEFPNNGLDETRTAHFDRPMKEIRVGESPSRPWGIQIPVKYTSVESSSSVGSAPTASPPLPLEAHVPVEETPKKPPKCPFDHQALGKIPQKKEALDAASITPQQPRTQPHRAAPPTAQPEPSREAITTPKLIPQMVFNGPVFLGYPPDQLMSLLQNSNLAGVMR